MSKYIDASLTVEIPIYEDEHKDWSIWNVTIEDLLNKWADQGCPPTIEVSKDCVSRADLIKSFLADNECEREEAGACMCSLDLMLELIEDAPSVVPTERTGEWHVIEYEYFTCDQCGEYVWNSAECTQEARDMLKNGECPNYCPNCGTRMDRGGDTK